MALTSEFVRIVNGEHQKIPLTEERVEELPVELNQLRRSALEALASHDFDRDPAEFRALLDALKWRRR